jgi:hypothetical protein
MMGKRLKKLADKWAPLMPPDDPQAIGWLDLRDGVGNRSNESHDKVMLNNAPDQA